MLPENLADELVQSGDAVSPFTTRGPGTTEVIHFVIEGINTAAAIVTLAAATEVYRKVARSVVRFAGNGKVTICGPKGEYEVSINTQQPLQNTAGEAHVGSDVKAAEEQIVAHLEAQTPRNA